jgi:hypothetical protein
VVVVAVVAVVIPIVVPVAVVIVVVFVFAVVSVVVVVFVVVAFVGVPRGREGGQTKKGAVCRAGVSGGSGRRGGGRWCVCAWVGERWQKRQKGVGQGEGVCAEVYRSKAEGGGTDQEGGGVQGWSERRKWEEGRRKRVYVCVGGRKMAEKTEGGGPGGGGVCGGT